MDTKLLTLCGLTWLQGYGSYLWSTVWQARVHVAKIVAEFVRLHLSPVRPVAGALLDRSPGVGARGAVVRARAAWPAVAGARRRGARRSAGPKPVLPPDITGQAKEWPAAATLSSMEHGRPHGALTMQSRGAPAASAGLRSGRHGLRVCSAVHGAGLQPAVQYPSEAEDGDAAHSIRSV